MKYEPVAHVAHSHNNDIRRRMVIFLEEIRTKGIK